ncbi:hypothetical protein N037_15760 [Enterobacter sp. EGD-HP1]|nr:hypothetical protein N037_15760 [Enterobacter sp. EGD-HP1]
MGKGQYINRLWAFMDDSITSSSNKDLAKSHVDYLGAWLQGSYKLTNKGVHSELTQIEATKAVFHTYLMISDILEYINLEKHSNGKKNINEASIDELEVMLDVKRGIAKNIVKKRIENGVLTLQLIKDIPGVGPKILSKIQAEFDI